MPTLMQRGVSLFQDRMMAAAGRQVVFARGATRLPLTAWVTLSDYQVVDGSGVPISITVRDYKFNTADLALKVQKGDRFEETTNGELHIVEVMPLADDPSASWVDADGAITVAHCKTVEIQK